MPLSCSLATCHSGNHVSLLKGIKMGLAEKKVGNCQDFCQSRKDLGIRWFTFDWCICFFYPSSNFIMILDSCRGSCSEQTTIPMLPTPCFLKSIIALSSQKNHIRLSSTPFFFLTSFLTPRDTAKIVPNMSSNCGSDMLAPLYIDIYKTHLASLKLHCPKNKQFIN